MHNSGEEKSPSRDEIRRGRLEWIVMVLAGVGLILLALAASVLGVIGILDSKSTGFISVILSLSLWQQGIANICMSSALRRARTVDEVCSIYERFSKSRSKFLLLSKLLSRNAKINKVDK